MLFFIRLLFYMKHLTCKEIGGPCDAVLEADTQSEMAQVATDHITELAKTDPVHAASYKEMEAIYNDKKRHGEWQEKFRKAWENAPER